jgi:hypothetical protein
LPRGQYITFLRQHTAEFAAGANAGGFPKDFNICCVKLGANSEHMADSGAAL